MKVRLKKLLYRLYRMSDESKYQAKVLLFNYHPSAYGQLNRGRPLSPHRLEEDHCDSKIAYKNCCLLYSVAFPRFYNQMFNKVCSPEDIKKVEDLYYKRLPVINKKKEALLKRKQRQLRKGEYDFVRNNLRL